MNGQPSRFGSSSGSPVGSHEPAPARTAAPARSAAPTRLRWRHVRWVLAAATVPLALWACNAHPLEQPKPAPEQQTDLVYEVNPVRKLDLLFVVDNSNSMMQEQANLQKNFPDFMTELTKIQGGLPDMHIAVVSSNVGAGQTAPAMECPPGGDRGGFQTLSNCGFDPAKAGGDYFLSVDGNQKTNFEDLGGVTKLPELFGCMATLGIKGCGYEHHLLSMYFALDGKTNVDPMTGLGRNQHFLRDDAYLGVVVIADEDDCSGSPTANFFEGSVTGQSGSLRCALKGHKCNGADIPAMSFMTDLSSCEPYKRAAGEEDSRLIDVSFFADFVKSLKRSPDKILVSTVIGWPDPANEASAKYALKQINTSRGLELDLAPICENAATGSAAPGIRLHSFAKSFTNNTVHPICSADLQQAMKDIGIKLRTILENTCITSPLFDTDEKTADIQADCQVFDQVPIANTSRYKDVAILPCAPGGPDTCWELVKDQMCSSGYRTNVKRPAPAEPGTLQSIRCLTCPMGSTDPRCVKAP